MRAGDWAAVVLALAVLGAAAWFLLRKPAPPAAPAAPEAQAPAAPAEPAAPAGPEEPAGAATEADARPLLEASSADPSFRRWLAEGDLVRRWVVVTDNLAEGVSPRTALPFLAPPGRFSAVQAGGELVIAPASHARYDRFADAVASVDARAAARAYRALHGVLQAAYRALGYPGASLDRVTARALGRLERTPVREDPVPVLDEGGVFVFADPALERLPAVEKHLLRMGPRNTRLVQGKAREIREALGLPAPPPGRGP
jgi:PAS domain-containing protein